MRCPGLALTPAGSSLLRPKSDDSEADRPGSRSGHPPVAPDRASVSSSLRQGMRTTLGANATTTHTTKITQLAATATTIAQRSDPPRA